MSSYWIKPNAMSQSPNRMIYLQVMALPGRLADSQTFHCAVTRSTRRFKKTHEIAPTSVLHHLTREALWTQVSAFTRKNDRTILVAYNLAEQLRLGQALLVLPALGWTLRRFSMHVDTAVVTWERDGAKLIMVDVKSWLPKALSTIAELVGHPLAEQPGPAAWRGDKLSWAESVCEVLDLSIGGLRDWIRDSDMGNWRPTGAGMAWANWRHAHYSHRVLAGGDSETTACEAASLGSGRAEAWRYGLQDSPPYIEWDLPLAYPRVALDAILPVAFFGETFNRKLDQQLNHGDAKRTLIRATVHQDLPVLGVKDDGHWVWPVGKLQGWWWDDELSLARTFGADITIERALIYRAAPVLKAWAEWIIPFIESPDSSGTALQRAAVKHWSRSLIGRFGLKYEDWRPEFVPADPGIYTAYLNDYDENVTNRLMVVGDQTWLSNERRYSSESVPSIMSAIIAECRIRLWQLMLIAGLDHVIYVDTDSLICDQVGSDQLAKFTAAGGGWGLRPKATHDHLEILGVRQLITEVDRKISGVPRTAERTGPRQFDGNVTEGLSTALARDRADVVYSPRRKFNLADTDLRRRHLENGYTAPYEL